MRYLDSLNKALDELLKNSEDVIIIGEDIIDPYGGAFKVTKGLSTKYPGKVISTPISEQAIVGISVGMGVRGIKTIAEIMFGDFLSLCFDQIINHMTKYSLMYDNKVSIPVVIRTPMGGGRGYGPTHSQNLEKYFVGIPNLQVIVPSELHDPGKSLISSVNYMKPVLFIEGKRLYPKNLITEKDFINTDWKYQIIENKNNIGNTICLTNSYNSSADITLISFGSTFEIINKAAEELLLEDEIALDVFMVENLTSIDYDIFKISIQQTGRVIIIEESTPSFGIGSEISSKIYNKFFNFIRKPVEQIGIKAEIIPSAKQLESQIMPSEQDIIGIARRIINDK